MSTQYYIDNYSSGSPRNICGPFDSLAAARQSVSGIKVECEPYEGVIEDLEKSGGTASLVEAWSKDTDSEDYQAIYQVEA